MKQAIAGVTAPDEKEVTVMTVWPSVAGMSLAGVPLGRILGRLYSIDIGVGFLTVGNFLCLATIPIALVLYFRRIGPFVATRYRLTNRRVLVERGLSAREDKAIQLDHFDEIEIVVKPGDEWFTAGTLVFKQNNIEKFMLDGVSRPVAFRHVCMKARDGYVGVQEALSRESAVA